LRQLASARDDVVAHASRPRCIEGCWHQSSWATFTCPRPSASFQIWINGAQLQPANLADAIAAAAMIVSLTGRVSRGALTAHFRSPRRRTIPNP